MRIVAGKHRSRVLKTRKGDETRPTLDKIKESFFSSIGPYFDGGEALDLFAGSGAIGLECISRGMSTCIFVDISSEAIQIIQENCTLLKEESNTACWKMDAQKALEQSEKEKRKFDFIYIDPPYGVIPINEILRKIDLKKLLNSQGIIICETTKEDYLEDTFSSFKIKKEAIYGITKIVIYKGIEGKI